MSRNAVIPAVTTVFGFAFDVVASADTASGFAPAADHLGSDEPLYAESRLDGFSAMLDLEFTKRLIIPGKYERRLKGRTVEIDGQPSNVWQGWAIRKMLVDDYGHNETHIQWLESTGATSNAAVAIKKLVNEEKLSLDEGSVEFVTSWYHCARTARIALRPAGLPPLVTPAESFTIARAELYGTRRAEEERLESYGGHFRDRRVIAEIGGIADWLLGRYEIKTRGW